MPIYEYLCKQCGEVFEKLVVAGAGEEVVDLKCPKCNRKKCIRLPSVFSAASCGTSGRYS